LKILVSVVRFRPGPPRIQQKITKSQPSGWFFVFRAAFFLRPIASHASSYPQLAQYFGTLFQIIALDLEQAILLKRYIIGMKGLALAGPWSFERGASAGFICKLTWKIR
jgi:hypothetical protein